MVTYREYDDFYFMSLGNGLMLDAKPMGSNARFANHSCDPNCVLQKWNVMGETRLVIVAAKPICRGEEINYNYNYYNDDLGDIPRQMCLCGSNNCSGTIGGRKVDPIEIIWMEKANMILNGGRRYTIDAAEQHLNTWMSMREEDDSESTTLPCNKVSKYLSMRSHSYQQSESINFSEIAERTATIEPLEYKRLHSAVENAKAWKIGAGRYLNHEKGKYHRTIKAKVFKDLLDKAPLCLKLEEYIDIENRLKACDKMDRLWRHWIKAGDGNGTLNNLTCDGNDMGSISIASKEKPKAVPVHSPTYVENTELSKEYDGKRRSRIHEMQSTVKCHSSKDFSLSSSPIIMKPKPPRRFTWNEWIINIKEMKSFSPIYCSAALSILQMYQEGCSWTNTHLCPYFFHGFQVMQKALMSVNKCDNRRAGMNLGHWTKSLWPIVRDLGTMYKVSIQPDFFILCDLLEYNLQIYMIRDELLSDPLNIHRHNRYVESISIGEDARIFGERNENANKIADGGEFNKQQNKPERTSKNNGVTDLNCETRVQMMMNNQSQTPQNEESRDKDRKLFCFCWFPEHSSECTTLVQCDDCKEWYHLACINLVSINSGSKRNVCSTLKCPVCRIDDREINPFLFPVLSEWNVNISKHVFSINCTQDNIMTQDIQLPYNMKDGRWSTRVKVHMSSVPYMSPEVFERVVVEGQEHLPFVNPPPILLLNLATKFISEWELRAKSKIENYILSYGRGRNIYEKIEKRKSYFIIFLRLYYHLRVVGVRPQRVDVLRRIIWDLSFDALFKVTIIGKIEILAVPHSYADICKIVEAGKAFYDSCGYYSGLSSHRLSALIRLQNTHECFMHNAAKVRSRPVDDDFSGWEFECIKLIRDWEQEAEGRIKLVEEDLYIRLKSIWAIHTFKKSKVFSNKRACTNARVSEPVIGSEQVDLVECGKEKSMGDLLTERWCWCMSADDGMPMVCCDSCDYWYHASCINYTIPKRKPRNKNMETRKEKKMDRTTTDYNFEDQTISRREVKAVEVNGGEYVGKEIDPGIVRTQHSSRTGRRIKSVVPVSYRGISNIDVDSKSKKREKQYKEVPPSIADDEMGRYICSICREVNDQKIAEIVF